MILYYVCTSLQRERCLYLGLMNYSEMDLDLRAIPVLSNGWHRTYEIRYLVHRYSTYTPSIRHIELVIHTVHTLPKLHR
jgi:hypothetical protein